MYVYRQTYMFVRVKFYNLYSKQLGNMKITKTAAAIPRKNVINNPQARTELSCSPFKRSSETESPLPTFKLRKSKSEGDCRFSKSDMFSSNNNGGQTSAKVTPSDLIISSKYEKNTPNTSDHKPGEMAILMKLKSGDQRDV